MRKLSIILPLQTVADVGTVALIPFNLEPGK